MTGAVLLFVLAVGMLLGGHFFRLLRWEQFIEVYERPKARSLLRSLSVGFCVNFFFPFHIGDLVRAVIAGRRMENGIAFSLATLIVERYLDIVAVGLVFAAFVCGGTGGRSALVSMQFYVWAVLLLLPVTVLLVRYSRYPKYVIRQVAAIFNERIQLRLLFVSWVVVSAFKDMYMTIERRRLLLLTAGMWGCYIGSYALFAASFTVQESAISFWDVFSALFSSTTFQGSTLQAGSNMGAGASLLLYGYVILPLAVLLLLSFLPERAKKLYHQIYAEPADYLNMLPQLREEDRLSFLEGYFSNRNRKYVSLYLKINRDINIIRDYSAGSNATTMLCMDHDKTFFRKYAFGADGKKLYEQLVWLHCHEGMLPLPKILQESYLEDCCYYDMEFNSAAVSLFEYIHSVPTARAWNLLQRVLECLRERLYIPTAWLPENDERLRGYIEQKVERNLERIHEAHQFRTILTYDTVFINGVEYRNLSAYERMLSAEHLYEVFSEDTYAEIHGDLTIENIICLQNGGEDDFYLIDPNTGNLHESPFLDYGKLLQSLHGGYEFLMKTKNVHVQGNHIDFLYTKSMAYEQLLQEFQQYLQRTFTAGQVRSIFYHELVHWLRLLPYKINKNGTRALIFYAGLIMLLQDICGVEEEAYEQTGTRDL